LASHDSGFVLGASTSRELHVVEVAKNSNKSQTNYPVVASMAVLFTIILKKYYKKVF
jgi:hypothetical protein